MTKLEYRNRCAVRAETEKLRVTVTVEGCHIAEITHMGTGVNPLWTPPWPSVEPSQYGRSSHPEYGDTDESAVLAGIMGHSLCLDTYGEPSRDELAAGMPIHGEAGQIRYEARPAGRDSMLLTGTLPIANIRFQRKLRLIPGRSAVSITEWVENLSGTDRPIAWTQHVTIGPPFLEHGVTQFAAPVARSKVIDADFGGAQKRGAEFNWPYCPRAGGGVLDLRTFPDEDTSGGFTTHLMDPAGEHAYFVCWSPSSRVALGYVWKREDFPWLCRWEENRLRQQAPWNGRTVACGMEFGVSPTVESRRDMVTRGSLWGVPAYRWLPARNRIGATYCALVGVSGSMPKAVSWDGRDSVEFVY